MSEMTAGLRALEMDERTTWYRDRARREQHGTVVSGPRRGLLRRVTRRAA